MLKYSAKMIAEELKKRGFVVDELNIGLYFATKGNISFFGESAKMPDQSSIVMNICLNKDNTKDFLNYFHYPTAKHKVINRDNLDEILDMQFPLVIKPLNLSGGTGVQLGVSNLKDLRKYFTDKSFDCVIAEETLQGLDYRLLVIGGVFFAACRREPPFILGNGINSISELVNSVNKARLQRHNDDVYLFPILVDKEYKETLYKAGKDENTVLENNEKLYVRRNANVSSGGMASDVTDLVCPSIKVMVESIANRLNASLLGVDIMANDLGKPLSDQPNSGVIELNHSPALWLHSDPHFGKSRNPAPLVVSNFIKKQLIEFE